MNAFKRLCLLFFSLAGIVSLVALTLPWFGPWTEWAVSMLTKPWYYITLEVCLCITALGLIITLVRAIFTPANRRTVLVTTVNEDEITVTTAAISSQATHIVEARGDLTAEHVTVRARKTSVDVDIRVRPTHAMNLTEEGAILHEELMTGLSSLAGDTIRSVNLEFVEADSLSAPPEYESYSKPATHGVPVSVETAPSRDTASATAADEYEITVPMGPAAEEAGAETAALTAGEEAAAELPAETEDVTAVAEADERALEVEVAPAPEPAPEPESEPEASPAPAVEPEPAAATEEA